MFGETLRKLLSRRLEKEGAGALLDKEDSSTKENPIRFKISERGPREKKMILLKENNKLFPLSKKHEL